ncbi:MAG: N-acetylmuramoyl-L-alanine amidase [Nitrospirae bacterium]|nr:N-acetylmuramoyl-L-alanine amidase [Nitrospirota bacterium]
MRVRKTILRGVYEDNLRIIGKGGNGLISHRYYYAKKVLLTLCLSLVALLVHANYVTGPFFQERQLTAGLITRDYRTTPDEISAKTDDYRAFMKNPGSLSRVFGLEVRTIMIDPGHGGADSGTIGKMGTREKDLTLDIAKRLRERLLKHGKYHIVLTREEDTTLSLNRRVTMAIANKADIFISIHLNYLPSKPINIIETYYFGPSSDSKILRLAEQENAGSEYGLSDFRDMIEKLGRTLKLQESRDFAYSIQKNLFVNIKKETGNAYNFGVKRAPFVVLLGVEVPSVLAEVSCLSNRDEEMKMNTASHRENIANYLEAGILDYLRKGDSKL